MLMPRPSEDLKFETLIAMMIIVSLTTHAASILGHSWSFSGEAGCF